MRKLRACAGEPIAISAQGQCSRHFWCQLKRRFPSHDAMIWWPAALAGREAATTRPGGGLALTAGAGCASAWRLELWEWRCFGSVQQCARHCLRLLQFLAVAGEQKLEALPAAVLPCVSPGDLAAARAYAYAPGQAPEHRPARTCRDASSPSAARMRVFFFPTPFYER